MRLGSVTWMSAGLGAPMTQGCSGTATSSSGWRTSDPSCVPGTVAMPYLRPSRNPSPLLKAPKTAEINCITGTLHYITLYYITFITLHYRRISGLRTVMLENIFGHWCRRYITLHNITLHYIACFLLSRIYGPSWRTPRRQSSPRPYCRILCWSGRMRSSPGLTLPTCSLIMSTKTMTSTGVPTRRKGRRSGRN